MTEATNVGYQNKKVVKYKANIDSV